MIEFFNQLPAPVISLIGFILTISFLVFIHEYGHFWVARRFGVTIEKFSIGFGKAIVKWRGKRDNTEYSIAWIPLGGYVKMYGENPTEIKPPQTNNTHDISDITDVNDTTKSSFSALPPLKRFLIAFAGPAVNLIFAILALWILFIVGVPALKPYIGNIEKNSPLYGQMQTGDKIIAINDVAVKTLTDTVVRLVDQIGNPRTVLTAIDDSGITKKVNLDLSNLPKGSELAIEAPLGFHWQISEIGQQQPAIVDSIVADSPAEKAKLAVGDTIVQANSQVIHNWQEFVTIIQNTPNQIITLKVLRHQQLHKLTISPIPHPENTAIGYVGVRGRFDLTIYDKFRTTKQYGIAEALPMSIKENYLQGKLILKTLARLITGHASIKNMGGPLSIADYSGQSLQMGYVAFFKFLAAISLTLAVMNLLPIPVLDGGHMMLCSIEMARGKPLSDKAAELLMRVGMSVMLTFMLLVISVDVWKYLNF